LWVFITAGVVVMDGIVAWGSASVEVFGAVVVDVAGGCVAGGGGVRVGVVFTVVTVGVIADLTGVEFGHMVFEAAIGDSAAGGCVTIAVAEVAAISVVQMISRGGDIVVVVVVVVVVVDVIVVVVVGVTGVTVGLSAVARGLVGRREVPSEETTSVSGADVRDWCCP
jgi:hypothetical protein